MSAPDPLAPGPSVHPWASGGAQRVRVGILVTRQSWPEMHDLAQMAEGLGFDPSGAPITPWSATMVGRP